MDLTIVGQECLDELADYAGLKDKVARITERAMQGEIDFRARCGSGFGCSPGSTRARSAAASTNGWDHVGRGDAGPDDARGGASCLLVSGGFLSFAEPVAKTVGFDRVRANRLVFAGGKLAAKSATRSSMRWPSATPWSRRATARPRARRRAWGWRRGQRQDDDRGSGAGIAFRAKPALAEVADAELRHHGLDALLWVQGVRRRDWFRG